MLGLSIYELPIYAALILGIIGMRSSFWRLHAVMAAMSILTLSVITYFFRHYQLGWDSLLAVGFFDILFGSIITVVMIKFENQRNNSRLYLYYAIILSVFFLTSMTSVAAWGMNEMGLYQGSILQSIYNKLILTANIIQVACLIEGGRDGIRKIINDIIHSNFSVLRLFGWDKESHPKIHKEKQ